MKRLFCHLEVGHYLPPVKQEEVALEAIGEDNMDGDGEDSGAAACRDGQQQAARRVAIERLLQGEGCLLEDDDEENLASPLAAAGARSSPDEVTASEAASQHPIKRRKMNVLDSDED